MKIKKHCFGVLSMGKKVHLYTVSNGMMAFSATNYGCTISSLIVPDKTGKKDDIVLGYSTLEPYIQDTKNFFGCLIGRVSNRIAKAQFSLNGVKYLLDANDGKNCLHGGFRGYNRLVWDSQPIKTDRGAGIRFTRSSFSGEQGFPGKLKIEVLYILTPDNELIMHYRAKTMADTPLSLTNHTYFNLAGQGRGDILSHRLCLMADSYLPTNAQHIPLGKILNVEGSPFDFRTEKTIGRDIAEAGGYDHSFCIRTSAQVEKQMMQYENLSSNLYESKKPLVYRRLNPCADVYESVSGRRMQVYTNQPAVQFYSGNFLNTPCGKNGLAYKKYSGLCLETQQYPDSVNQKTFPSCILKPDEMYEAVTVHRFSWKHSDSH